MESSTVSNKYQIVIPKKLRQQLGVKPGQRLHMRVLKSGSLVVNIGSALDEYSGSIKGVWGEDPVGKIRKDRDSWDKI